MQIFLNEKVLKFAERFWNENNLNNKFVIGVCPGGARNVGIMDDDLRRWDIKKYAELIYGKNWRIPAKKWSYKDYGNLINSQELIDLMNTQ